LLYLIIEKFWCKYFFAVPLIIENPKPTFMYFRQREEEQFLLL